jgi:chromosome partitioning protein
METKIISVAHRKGGMGKTSVTLHLATALATKKKRKVIVLDIDSQQSAYKYREFEKNSNYEGVQPPYEIERIQPKFLTDELRSIRGKYDVIFIDVPRMTEGNDESQLSTTLTFCDYVLVPIVAGHLEGLSTTEFVKLVKEIGDFKSKKEIPFTYYGFLNKRNQRAENQMAVDFMKRLKLPMFESSLSDVKALSNPFTYESVLDTKEGAARFEPFFNEFLKKFKV